MKVPAQVQNPKIVWAVLGLIGVSWEWYCIKEENGGTLSETTRSCFRVNTKPGRAGFLVSVGFVLTWYPTHILRDLENSAKQLSNAIST